MADFDPNSATFGVWPTNGSSSSRNNILRNRFFHEVIEIINEAAAQNTLEGHAGLERLRRVASRRSPTMTVTPAPRCSGNARILPLCVGSARPLLNNQLPDR